MTPRVVYVFHLIKVFHGNTLRRMLTNFTLIRDSGAQLCIRWDFKQQRYPFGTVKQLDLRSGEVLGFSSASIFALPSNEKLDESFP